MAENERPRRLHTCCRGAPLVLGSGAWGGEAVEGPCLLAEPAVSAGGRPLVLGRRHGERVDDGCPLAGSSAGSSAGFGGFLLASFLSVLVYPGTRSHTWRRA